MSAPDVIALSRLIPGYDPWETAGNCAFDERRAEKAVSFFAECLRFTEGDRAGEPFALEPWQAAVVVNLHGWYRPDGTRRYREAFVYVPRKNGKTCLLAGLLLHEMFCVPEAGAQLYSAAAEREQAALIFRHAAEMVGREPELSSRCSIKPSMKVIERTDGQWSMFKALSADASTKHGLSVSFAVIDELHAHPNGELVRTLTTGTGARRQPLVIYITTADYMRESICNDKYQHACRVRDGLSDDFEFLPVVYEALPDDDWTDPAVWRKANPNFGVSVKESILARECRLAQEMPTEENTFRRLRLNQRTQQDVRAIPMDKWDACGTHEKPMAWRERMLTGFAGRKCAGGLDLGAVSDLTALSLLFGDEHDGYTVLPFFWCPEESAHKRSRTDGVDYVQWANAGFITLTEGNEVHYGKVIEDIDELADRYGIYEIAADRLFQGAQLCQTLTERGMNVTAMGQGYVSMAAPTRRFLELLNEGKLFHGNNPVLRWMAGNAACESQNKSGEILKFSKAKSTEKIDGIIATANALAVATKGGDPVWDFQPGTLAI